LLFIFFFQAEDGIRDKLVTGVQTCALPISRSCMILLPRNWSRRTSMVTFEANRVRKSASSSAVSPPPTTAISRSRKKKPSQVARSEERRVGKEGRSRG